MYALTRDWISAGDVIETHDGKLMKVKKVNPANYVSMDENGKVWNVRRTGNVKRAENPENFKDPEAHAAHIVPGMLVRFNKVTLRRTWGANVFVVAGDSGAGLKLFPLGGGRGLRGFQAIDMDIVDLEGTGLV